MTNIEEVVQKTTLALKSKGFSNARLDAEILMATALQINRIDLYLRSKYPLSEPELNRCREFLRRRFLGEPVAYICGSKEFYGHSFKVGPGVLIPRPETEHLVDEVLSLAPLSAPLNVFELGVGSGCIGLSLLQARPLAQLLAVEISATAMKFAQQNAEQMQLAQRVRFIHQDALDLSFQEFPRPDFVLGNPPYLDVEDCRVDPFVRSFEPPEALFSQENGLYHLRNWLKIAEKILKPGGYAVMEIGAGQSALIKPLLTAFCSYYIVKDYAGHDRVVVAQKGNSDGQDDHQRRPST